MPIGLGAVAAGLIVKQQTKTSPLEYYDILGYTVLAIVLACVFLFYRVSQLVKSKVQ